MGERILLVEDDDSLREGLFLALGDAGYSVATTADGDKALALFDAQPFDIVLLDVMMPGRNGIDVVRKIRESSSVPVVMLTARGDAADIVLGLESGADDYVVKPAEVAVLLARIRAALRRSNDDWGTSGVLRSGTLKVDTEAVRAFRDESELDLTATEFRLLTELIRKPGKALSRKELLDRVWGYDHLGDSRIVDMAVKRLRGKLGDDAEDPRLIETVRGVGYRLAT